MNSPGTMQSHDIALQPPHEDNTHLDNITEPPLNNATSTATPSRPPITLETTRLLLRAAQMSDLDHFFSWYSDPDIMKYWDVPPHANPTITSKTLTHMTTSPNNGHKDFVIVHKSTNLPIGKMGMWNHDTIGYMLDKRYWRQGIAGEAMVVLLRHLFDVEGVRYIVADVDPRNEASVRMLEKFGFVVTGREEKTYCVGGQWVDSVYLRLENPKFEGEVRNGEENKVSS